MIQYVMISLFSLLTNSYYSWKYNMDMMDVFVWEIFTWKQDSDCIPRHREVKEQLGSIAKKQFVFTSDGS